MASYSPTFSACVPCSLQQLLCAGGWVLGISLFAAVLLAWAGERVGDPKREYLALEIVLLKALKENALCTGLHKA